MAKILTLICVLVFAFLANPVRSQRDGFYFDSFSGTNTSSRLSLNGVAEVEKNGMIRLTNDTRRLLGHAFYPNPIRFKKSADGKAFSFSTAFAFAIVPEYPKLGGHGMAFVIANSKELTGALPSQYLGLLNATDNGNSTNHIFAVEFDTVQDFEFGDIDDNHVGIDMNSLTSNASASAASGPEALNLKSGRTIAAWVDYDSVTNLLNVSISSLSTKPVSPVLSHKVDLSPILQETMFAGFSASTGLLASSHYLFGWSFKMNGQARPLQLSSLPSLPRPKRSHTDLILGLSISTTLFIIFAVAAVIFLIWKIKNADFIEAWEFNVGPHRFSYKELKKATKNFRDKELLGSGGFGKVYKGVLPKSKIQVAVKRIAHESRQGLREFASEIAIMGRLRHRNLVQLLGWGRRRGDLLLVYDYMPNGSLDKYIYEDHKDDVHLLSWEQRFKVIKHVASGLLYLHEEWEQTVIHRDVKAGNVLLDSEMNGRLGDFGLAKLYEHGANPSTTRVVGTLGYLAPELTKTGKPTTGSDVFAFGALLLEVVCGRRPVEPKRPAAEVILVDWVWGKWEEGAILDVVDRRLRGEFDEAEATLVLKLGLMCSNDAGVGRPSMRQVVRYLEGEAALPEVLEAPAITKGASGGFQFEDYVHSYNDSVTYEKMSDLEASGFSLSGSVDGGGR